MKRGSVFRIPHIQEVYPMPYIISYDEKLENIMLVTITRYLMFCHDIND